MWIAKRKGSTGALQTHCACFAAVYLDIEDEDLDHSMFQCQSTHTSTKTVTELGFASMEKVFKKDNISSVIVKSFTNRIKQALACRFIKLTF